MTKLQSVQERSGDAQTDVLTKWYLCDFSFDLFSHFLVKQGLIKVTQIKTEWIWSKRIYCYLLFSKSHKYLWVCTDRQCDSNMQPFGGIKIYINDKLKRLTLLSSLTAPGVKTFSLCFFACAFLSFSLILPK
jgi:hypothetical protein